MSATTLSPSASSGISTSISLGVWVMPMRTSTWSHSPHDLSDGSEATSTLLRRGRLLDMHGPPTSGNTERSARWAATMAGYAARGLAAGPRGHTLVGRRRPGRAGGTRHLADELRARPRPDLARHVVPPVGR